MRIGFASIFAFRPHVEHIWYLAQLLKGAGHETFFFACDGALELCYARALKGTPKAVECPICMLAGIRSYTGRNVSAIRSVPAVDVTAVDVTAVDVTAVDVLGVADSSIYSVLRTETVADCNSPAARSLRERFLPATERTYRSGLDWIRRQKLDGVVCFNGRMDATRALTRACARAGIPFITLERTWFGDGLQLIPNADCLSLAPVKALNSAFRDSPLTLEQARYVGWLLASRFLGRNQREWRAYNLNATPASWPVATAKRKVLLLPSSRCEFQLHPDWQLGWGEATDAFDWLFRSLAIAPDQVVLRCHPNWAERIGRKTGARALNHYTRWAAARGIHCISSDQKTSTFDLIAASDLIVVNGSSAAFEGAALGKPIVCMGSAHYTDAGIALHLASPADAPVLTALERHDATSTTRASLRFAYTMMRRFAQFTDFVRCITPTRYTYSAGADPDRVIRMLLRGVIEPDDAAVAADTEGEDVVLSLVERRQWQELHRYQRPRPATPQLAVRRRRGLGWLDGVRALLPTGDRL
jgi:hypothetical protein